jgi:hypothetical protein
MSDGNYKDEANVSWTPESDSFFVLKFSSAEMADRLEPWALTQMLVCDRRGLQFCHPAEQQIPRTAKPNARQHRFQGGGARDDSALEEE